MAAMSMKKRCISIAKRILPFNAMESITRRLRAKTIFTGSKEYWEERYAQGGTSGDGSYGKCAEFKAEIINSFVKSNQVNSVIEYGCGDGNQLSLFNFPKYIGMDVSSVAIRLCMERFENDRTKSFFLYDSECFDDKHNVFKAELALSLDVIYHLIEDHLYILHMKQLFSSADKFVIIYSSDFEMNPVDIAPHNKSRQFSKWIESKLPQWSLVSRINNRYPNESWSDLFIYKKIE
jgi:hypothetical protein